MSDIATHVEHQVHEHDHATFFDTLLRGFAWRSGGDVANWLFHAAPGLIILLVVVALVVSGWRRLIRRR
jgi:hypothetical protein